MLAEFDKFLSPFGAEQYLDGRRRIVRNGHLPKRQILTGTGRFGRWGPEGVRPVRNAGAVALCIGGAVRRQ